MTTADIAARPDEHTRQVLSSWITGYPPGHTRHFLWKPLP
jgi:hypothetical protein